MTRRKLLANAGVAVLAMVTGWIALWSWRGLVEFPERFLGPTLVAGLLLALTGTLARTRRAPWHVTVLAQCVVLALFFNHRMGAAESWLRWVPTRSSVQHVWHQLSAGAEALGTQYSPVPDNFPGVHDTLALSAVALLLLIDLLACGLGRVPLAGLPLLVIWMIPISLLGSGLNWFVFVVTALLFVMLLATEETRRVLAWGRSIAGRGRRFDSLDQIVSGESVRAGAVRIGLLTCVAALFLPLFVPLAHHSFSGGGPGPGPGDGTRTISIVNPMVDLRRDLVKPQNTPMLDVDTLAADPSYVRLTVLDEFSGASWRPSGRQLSKRADGELSPAPGLTSEVPGSTSKWTLQLFNTFETAWLPTPYPLRSISISKGDWRYDPRTLDIADAHGDPFQGELHYELTAFKPDLHAVRLNDAFQPPSSVREAMTQLPANLPEVIRATAEQVTRGKTTTYEKAVALQDWFRATGGFRYSLDRAPGSGMRELADFITVDKVGYCEQFAAAMAVMGRALDIPSRVVVGFLRPERLGDTSYRFSSDDLHAWPEMYFTGVGWVPFEPTPATRTGVAPSWTTEALPAAPSSTATSKAEATAPKPAPKPPADQGSQSAGASRSQEVLPWLGAVLVLILLATPRLLRDLQRRSRLASGQDTRALAGGLWAELQASAVDVGISWHPERSARQTGRALVRRLRPGQPLLGELEQLVQFVERARYGRPFEVDDATTATLRRTVTDWSRALATTVPRSRARWAAVLPRSVWRLRGRSAGLPAQEGRGRSDELVGSGPRR